MSYRNPTVAPGGLDGKDKPAMNKTDRETWAIVDSIVWFTTFLGTLLYVALNSNTDFEMRYHLDGVLWRNLTNQGFTMVPLPIGRRPAALSYIYCILKNNSTSLISSLVDTFPSNEFVISTRFFLIGMLSFLTFLLLIRIFITSCTAHTKDCSKNITNTTLYHILAVFFGFFDEENEIKHFRSPMMLVIMSVMDIALLIIISYFVGMNGLQYPLLISLSVMIAYFCISVLETARGLQVKMVDMAKTSQNDVRKFVAYGKTAYSTLVFISSSIIVISFSILWLCILLPYGVQEHTIDAYDYVVESCRNNPGVCPNNDSIAFQTSLASFVFERDTWMHPPMPLRTFFILIASHQIGCLVSITSWDSIGNLMADRAGGVDRRKQYLKTAYFVMKILNEYYFLISTVFIVITMSKTILNDDRLNEHRILLDCAGTPCLECSSVDYPFSFMNLPSPGTCIAPMNSTDGVCPS